MKSEWVTIPLGDVMALQRGHDLPTQDRLSGDVPILGSSGITGYHNEAKATGPGVTVGRSGNSMGEISYSNKEFWPLNTALYITDFKGNDPKFLYYLLKTINFDQFNSGSAQKSLNRNAVYPFEVKIPKSFIVQRRISSILSSLEDKVEINYQINQTLEQMAQAIFKSWFVDFDPVSAKVASLEAGGSEEDALLAAMQVISGKDTEQLTRLQAEKPKQYTELRATAKLFPPAMQDSELGAIPEGWEVLPLTEMVDLIGGGTPKKSEPTFWNGEICWFSVKDVPSEGNIFVVDTGEKITEEGVSRSSTKLLPIGTTIITARGTVGKLALTGIPTAMNQSCYGVVATDGTGPYLNYLRLSEAVDTLKRNTHGAVFDTITRSTFETAIQSRSCPALRRRFEEAVTPMFEAIRCNLLQSNTLSETRDLLLPQLLSGELSVSEAEGQLVEAEETADV